VAGELYRISAVLVRVERGRGVRRGGEAQGAQHSGEEELTLMSD